MDTCNGLLLHMYPVDLDIHYTTRYLSSSSICIMYDFKTSQVLFTHKNPSYIIYIYIPSKSLCFLCFTAKNHLFFPWISTNPSVHQHVSRHLCHDPGFHAFLAGVLALRNPGWYPLVENSHIAVVNIVLTVLIVFNSV